MNLKYKLIAVTGTKGKTSVVRMLDFLFLANKKKTLRVDTDGHFINGKQKSTFMDSRELYKLYPTVSPGRYLYEFENANRESHVGIFETSIGCARKSGMGYFRHHIGIFTNVFEDHIDDEMIKSKADILERKASFILQVFKKHHFIYNFDDELLYELRNSIKKELKLVAVSLNYDIDFLQNALDREKMVLTVKDNSVVKIQDGEIEEILDLNKFADAPIKYKPFLYNVLFVAAAALSYGLNKEEIEKIYKYKFDYNGGRLTLFQVKDKFVLLDYAHEKYSLKSLAEFVENTGRHSTGVIRLDYKRTLKLIKDTGKFIAEDFDAVYIYDKIDGVKKKSTTYCGEDRKKGAVSAILYDAIKNKRKKNKTVFRFLGEEKAFLRAFEKAPKGGIIVLIVDDLQSDLKLLKKMKAKRVKFSQLYK